jgi:hypothetical protein
MTDNRMSGWALIAGSVASIITMSLHPTGHDLFTPGKFQAVMRLGVAVHALALVSLPVLFLGACGLARHLAAAGRLAFAALVIYGFSLAAIMNAAVFSGLVDMRIASRIFDKGPEADAWRIAFNYTGDLNQSFALVYVVASSAAILLWSVTILRSGALARGIGIYGCILAPITVLAVLSGHLSPNVHGFGAIILGQAIWLISTAVQLCRADGRVSSIPAPSPQKSD